MTGTGFIKYTNSKILLVGDFNRIPLEFFCSEFNLMPCINFATRGVHTLDQILTNAKYPAPVKLPSLVGNENDHCAVFNIHR